MPHIRYPIAPAPRPRTLYYRVSDDALIHILEYLDPASLWKACKALTRIRRLVRDVASLRYNFELALFGLKDGPLSHRRMPIVRRAQHLHVYKHHWSLREPPKELSLPFNLSSIVGVSGRVIFNIENHGLFNMLNLFELPSPRLVIPPTVPIPQQCPSVEDVAVDQVQGLLMSTHVYTRPDKHIGLKLYFRDTRTKGVHSQAFAPEYDVDTGAVGKLNKISSIICGSKIVVSLEFVGGKVQHLLANWHTFQGRWLKDLSIHFMDERSFLGINRAADGTACVTAYDLQDVMLLAPKAYFLLPAEWTGTQRIEFAKSSSPQWDTRIPSNASFSVAPEFNMVVFTLRPTVQGAGQQWFCAPETFFRFLPRKKATTVLWKDWSYVCRPIMNVANSFVVAGPYVMGSRVIYVDYHDKVRRLCMMDLSQFHPLDASIDTSKGQHDDKHRKLAPECPEVKRPVSSRVEDVKVTEDNIVLILNDSKHGRILCQVWTFGTPP